MITPPLQYDPENKVPQVGTIFDLVATNLGELGQAADDDFAGGTHSASPRNTTIGPRKFFGGYEYIDLANPNNPAGARCVAAARPRNQTSMTLRVARNIEKADRFERRKSEAGSPAAMVIRAVA